MLSARRASDTGVEFTGTSSTCTCPSHTSQPNVTASGSIITADAVQYHQQPTACSAGLQARLAMLADGESRAYMGGVERNQRNVGVVNLHRIAEALDMSLSELFAEVEGEKGRDGSYGRDKSSNPEGREGPGDYDLPARVARPVFGRLTFPLLYSLASVSSVSVPSILCSRISKLSSGVTSPLPTASR
jgi:transcriptional regulator with XRE-family HTH domain